MTTKAAVALLAVAVVSGCRIDPAAESIRQTSDEARPAIQAAAATLDKIQVLLAEFVGLARDVRAKLASLPPPAASAAGAGGEGDAPWEAALYNIAYGLTTIGIGVAGYYRGKANGKQQAV